MDGSQSNQMKIPKSQETEDDFLGILHKIICIRKIIYKAAGVGLIIGIIVALSIPQQYTVQVTLSPEMGTSKVGNGLSDLAASFLGTNGTVNDGVGALNASLSSNIVSSTPFLLELSKMQVPISQEENIILETYLENESSPWWNYVIGIPALITNGIKSLFVTNNVDKITVIGNKDKGAIELSETEAERIESLKKMINASMDIKTGITTITATLQTPRVAAVVADSVVKKLQEYIIDYRTSKAKEDCNYLEKLFKDRQEEYYTAQKKYASYVDSHDNIILQRVRTEQERLQNDMNLTFQVYNQVANQLQVARAKIQEVKPVFAIVEPAVIPLNPTGIGRKMYVLGCVFLSVLVVILWDLYGRNYWANLKNIQF